jgi:hypothetical protein
VLIVAAIVVLAVGAGVGFVASRPPSAGGTVKPGTTLPPLATVTFTPETVYVPPALPTTTTTVKPPKQVVKNVTQNKNKTVNKSVSRSTTVQKP